MVRLPTNQGGETSVNKLFNKKEFFPVFSSGGGDYILINLNAKKNVFGQLFLCSPSILMTNKPIAIYDSLNSLFTTLLEIYRQKGYYFKGGFLEIDFNMEESISKRMNPNSNFWKES
jgi:hypothetical protein